MDSRPWQNRLVRGRVPLLGIEWVLLCGKIALQSQAVPRPEQIHPFALRRVLKSSSDRDAPWSLDEHCLELWEARS